MVLSKELLTRVCHKMVVLLMATLPNEEPQEWEFKHSVDVLYAVHGEEALETLIDGSLTTMPMTRDMRRVVVADLKKFKLRTFNLGMSFVEHGFDRPFDRAMYPKASLRGLNIATVDRSRAIGTAISIGSAFMMEHLCQDWDVWIGAALEWGKASALKSASYHQGKWDETIALVVKHMNPDDLNAECGRLLEKAKRNKIKNYLIGKLVLKLIAHNKPEYGERIAFIVAEASSLASNGPYIGRLDPELTTQLALHSFHSGNFHAHGYKTNHADHPIWRAVTAENTLVGPSLPMKLAGALKTFIGGFEHRPVHRMQRFRQSHLEVLQLLFDAGISRFVHCYDPSGNFAYRDYYMRIPVAIQNLRASDHAAYLSSTRDLSQKKHK